MYKKHISENFSKITVKLLNRSCYVAGCVAKSVAKIINEKRQSFFYNKYNLFLMNIKFEI